MRKDLPYDEGQVESGATPTTHVDDEYARAGIFDPKVLITTSRDPSSRLQQFAKEMRLCVPSSQRINRGNYVMKNLVETCRANQVTDLIILHEHRGQPGNNKWLIARWNDYLSFPLWAYCILHSIQCSIKT